MTTPNKATYTHFAEAIESDLDHNIIACWYPRAVDTAHGGFREEFDEQWKPIGPGTTRSIVYQSRLTWVAAQAIRRYPTRAEEFRTITKHGIASLRDSMWDREDGGFYWQVDVSGAAPVASGTTEKHAYGNSFGIYACAAAYEQTHDPAALELAKKAFLWLDEHAHDDKNGGYYEALTREGKPVLTQDSPYKNDSIGTRHGQKSMNTHIHLLEAYSELYRVWPDAHLKVRLDELFHVVRDRVYAEPGRLNMFFAPDWHPVSDEDSFGHDIETAFLITEAAEVLGHPDDTRAWTVARKLVDNSLAVGWDTKNGGFYDHGTVGSPASGTDKVWWTQAEGLNALLLMHARYGKETPRYFEAFEREWAFIEKYQVDHTNGGWRTSVSRDGVPVSGQSKSDAWKDPYHQGRALLHVSERLRKL